MSAPVLCARGTCQEGVDSLGALDAAAPLAAFHATNRRHMSHVVFGGTEVRQSATLRPLSLLCLLVLRTRVARFYLPNDNCLLPPPPPPCDPALARTRSLCPTRRTPVSRAGWRPPLACPPPTAARWPWCCAQVPALDGDGVCVDALPCDWPRCEQQWRWVSLGMFPIPRLPRSHDRLLCRHVHLPGRPHAHHPVRV
jgi:hypothetical protein